MKLSGLAVLALAVAPSGAFTVTPSSVPSVGAPVRPSLVPLAARHGAAVDDESDNRRSFRMPFAETLSEPLKSVGSFLLATALVLGVTGAVAPPAPASATESKIVGELKGSGLVFKDTLQIERFEDPKVKGVTLYISNFDRPITEKLSGNFFNDPSYASVACAKTGPVAIADNINKSKNGEEVFQESRSLLFKTLRVQRIYDEDNKTVIYVSFNTRLDKNDDSNKSRFKSSLCAVNLDDGTSPVSAQTAQAAAPVAAAK